MKKIIIILFTIILAVYIGSNYITGDNSTSLKKGAENIFNRASNEINCATGIGVK